jgi:hypothetical protein
MSWYDLKNNAQTTLATLLNASASTATVTNAVALPSIVPFLLTIWDREGYPDPSDDTNMEIVQVDFVDLVENKLTFNMVGGRGKEGTSAAIHASGEAVANLITAGTLKQIEGVIDGLLGALLYKGSVDCSSNPNYPEASAGHTYEVSVAGKIGGGSGRAVGVGDLFVCIAETSASGTEEQVGGNWTILQAKSAAGYVEANAGIAAATKTKITYDEKGLVTAGDDATTDDIAQGETNRYFTDATADTWLSDKTSDDVAEGATNKYYSDSRVETLLGTKTTDDIAQGDTNKYFTDTTADTWLSGKSSDDVAEGSSNKYYSDAHV